MRKVELVILLSAIFVVLCASPTLWAQVPASFFDMQMEHATVTGEPWPVDSFGNFRLWDSATAWAVINTAPGQYDWSMLDSWLKAAKDRNMDVEYTFGRVPQWASSNPNDSVCASAPGSCAPPNDLNSDGSGTNQHWKDYVTAIATRVNDPTYLQTHAPIKYWEIWDEAPNPGRWNPISETAGIAQMLRMASDARTIILSIDSTATILSPSVGIRVASETKWFKDYLAAGGGNYADIIAFHAYLQTENEQPIPEQLLTYLTDWVENDLQPYGQENKPRWDTEASWGIATCCNFTDQDLQAGFVARYYLMHWLGSVQRFYWYAWSDTPAGTLWVANPKYLWAPGTLLKPGKAYGQIYRWMVGDSVDQSCAPQGTVWACNVTGPNGFQGQIVWDTSQTCSKGTCTYSNYNCNPIFTQYVTLLGTVFPVKGSTVPIGYKPIFLENQNQ
jgi:polysaccharide biosynthesis protein PslG